MYRNHNNWSVVIILLALLHAEASMADAIIRSQAMFADTIAEYYVEDDHVRLELEIGSNDVGSFRNLLPDALYQQLDFGDTPLEERLPLFTVERHAGHRRRQSPVRTSDQDWTGYTSAQG